MKVLRVGNRHVPVENVVAVDAQTGTSRDVHGRAGRPFLTVHLKDPLWPVRGEGPLWHFDAQPSEIADAIASAREVGLLPPEPPTPPQLCLKAEDFHAHDDLRYCAEGEPRP
jgi:hypothetical protein